jgi:phytoene dehydrogenase-like protein
LPAIFLFRKPLGVWTRDHLKSEPLQRFLLRLLPAEAPVLFLLMMLGYLERGYLSRVNGGTRAFLDALIGTYRALGGEVLVHTTVDEILIEGDRARGARLSDGTIIDADIVVSTSSAPETVLRLLGGRYDAQETRARLERWHLFSPLVLASFGVALPLTNTPATQIIDGLEPFEVGGCDNDHLMLRVYNDEPSFAPAGHTVVQLTLKTKYDWWAKRGVLYNTEKDAVGQLALEQADRYIPGVRAAARVRDVATPLTFWNMARSWRGAYEGWMPSSEGLPQHVNKTLSGLSGFYMAGQWVEPGGGIPMALMSGRQVAEIVCAARDMPFASHAMSRVAASGPAAIEDVIP